MGSGEIQDAFSTQLVGHVLEVPAHRFEKPKGKSGTSWGIQGPVAKGAVAARSAESEAQSH